MLKFKAIWPFVMYFGSYYVFNMFIIIDNAWCTRTLGDGHIDPYGSIAIHGAISIAFKGNKYLREEVVNMTITSWLVCLYGEFFLETNDA